MSIVCEKCGSEIAENSSFCTECGAAVVKSEVKAEKKAEKKSEASAKEVKKEEVVEKKPISENVFHNSKSNAKPLHSVAYFFLMLLFAVPVVGLIASIAFSASSKNENLANYGKAVFIWKIIGLVITLVVAIAFLIMLRRAGITFDYIGQTFKDAFAFALK